jgi:hypothetical protein
VELHESGDANPENGDCPAIIFISILLHKTTTMCRGLKNMQTLIDKLPVQKNKETSFIFKMLPSALSKVSFHENTIAITRYFADDFPVHLAVHKVSPVITAPKEYTLPHLHEDSDEMNIILSEHSLLYKINLGADEYTVSNNSCIWIPRGMIHAANVLRGSGYFITMRIN